MTGGGFTMDGPSFGRLMNELKAADRKMATAVRKELREQIKAAQRDVEKKLAEPSPDGGSRSVGTRAAIASGLATRIGTGKNPSVRITASSKNLPADRKPMLRAYNKETWRHPVFARSTRAGGLAGLLGVRNATWVEQKGNPYFREVLERRRLVTEMAIFRAMEQAHRRLIEVTTD